MVMLRHSLLPNFFMRNLIKAIQGNRPFLVDYQLAQDHIQLKKSAGLTDLIKQMFGDTPKPYQVGGTFVIPVTGMIGKGLSPMEAIGSADVEVIDDQIDQALAANPSRILFHINSDGGTVDGVEELADKIRSLPIETIAFSSGSMNSAAYWIGSACTRVVVSPSSSIASVGVYLTLMDQSAQAKAAGVQVKVYKSGAFKGIGVPYTSTTPEQDDYLQKEVDALAESFKASVKMKRKMVQDSDLQGQSMPGKMAAQKGFATGLANSLKDLLAQLEGGTATQAKSTAPVISSKAKNKATAFKAQEGETEAVPFEADGLNPRQRYLVDELEGIAETFGEFDQSSLADGSHYVAKSPFTSQGLICSNCVFYQGGRKCKVVAGDIDPEAICKLWVIPAGLVKE